MITHEGIISTYDTENQPRASPVGYNKKGEQIIITLYEKSQSLENIINNRDAVLNLEKDPEILAGTAFDLLSLDFKDSDNVNAPILSKRSHFELKLQIHEEGKIQDKVGSSSVHDIVFNIVDSNFIKDENTSSPSYYRGGHFLLESAIKLTRAHAAFQSKGDPGKFLKKSRQLLRRANDLGIKRKHLISDFEQIIKDLEHGGGER